MGRAWFIVVLVVTGCWKGVRSKATLRGEAAAVLLAPTARHDAAALADLLGDSVTYAGLYFADPACAKQFAAPRDIAAAERAAFARCLATLPLRASQRSDIMFGVGVYEYDPGIEIEAVFLYPGQEPRLAWIGYAGRRDGNLHPPTITRALLEANRLGGDPLAHPTGAEQVALGTASAWLDVCVGPSGDVIGVHRLEVSSVEAEAAFTAAIRNWQFKPIALGGRAAVVCAQLPFVTPAKPIGKEWLPAVFDLPAGAVRVPRRALEPRAREVPTYAHPTDQEWTELHDRGLREIRLGFRFCADPHGAASDVLLIEPSGVTRVDHVHETAIRAWTFQPFLVDGVPAKACASVFFEYAY